MVKKNLFKKITALSLSLCLALTPTMAYAGDLSADEEIIMMDDASEGEGLAVEEDTADFEEPVLVEDAASEEEGLAGGEDLERTDDVVVEDTSTDEETFGVDDETMALLTGGNEVIDEIVTEETVTDDADLATTYKIHFNIGTGSGTSTMTDQTVESGVSTPLDLNTLKNTKTGFEGFAGWSTSSTGTTVTYRDGASISVTAETTLYAVWGAPVATVTETGVQYAYLKDAFAAVPWNGTVTLTSDSKSTEAITVNRSCTLAAGDYAVAGQITVAAGNQLIITGDEAAFSYVPKEDSSDALKLQGGIYPSNVIDLCDTGFYVTTVTESNKTYYKVIDSAVARIDKIYYKTFADALAGVNASSGTVTLYLINDITNADDAGKIDDTVVKNNLVIKTGKENDEAVSVFLRNSGGNAAKIRFDGTLSIDDDVSIDGVLIGSVKGTTITGDLGSPVC